MLVRRLGRRGIILAVFVFVGGGKARVLGNHDGAEVVSIGGDAHGTAEAFESVGQAAFVPDVQVVFAIRDSGNGNGAGLVGNRVIRRIHSHDNCAHLRMNIAEEKADACMVEADGVGGTSFIEPEIETLAIEERKDVVKEGIAIREVHDGTDADNGEVRMKRLILLDDLRLLAGVGGSWYSVVGRNEPHDHFRRVGTLLRFGRSWTLDGNSGGDGFLRGGENPNEERRRW